MLVVSRSLFSGRKSLLFRGSLLGMLLVAELVEATIGEGSLSRGPTLSVIEGSGSTGVLISGLFFSAEPSESISSAGTDYDS